MIRLDYLSYRRQIREEVKTGNRDQGKSDKLASIPLSHLIASLPHSSYCKARGWWSGTLVTMREGGGDGLVTCTKCNIAINVGYLFKKKGALLNPTRLIHRWKMLPRVP